MTETNLCDCGKPKPPFNYVCEDCWTAAAATELGEAFSQRLRHMPDPLAIAALHAFAYARGPLENKLLLKNK